MSPVTTYYYTATATNKARMTVSYECEKHVSSTEEIEAVVRSLGKLEAFKGSRWATVANPNTLVFGVARVFCCLAESEGFCIEPFSAYEAACDWLREPESEVSS